MSKLLINESPLQVLPSLAAEVGLNEAIVLQQIHYWTQPRGQWKPKEHDGHRWVYNSYARWVEQFPFWSESTVRRVIKSLEKEGLIISTQPNKADGDTTKWYRINHTALQKIEDQCTPPVQDEHPPPVQDEQGGMVNMNKGGGQYEQSRAYSKERARDRDYTETTTKKKRASESAPQKTNGNEVPNDQGRPIDEAQAIWEDVCDARPDAATAMTLHGSLATCDVEWQPTAFRKALKTAYRNVSLDAGRIRVGYLMDSYEREAARMESKANPASYDVADNSALDRLEDRWGN